MKGNALRNGVRHGVKERVRPYAPKAACTQTSAAPARNPCRHDAHGALERLALWASRWTGSSWGFNIAVAIIVVWLVSGPLFGFSDTWQLIINTGTTIVTFLMVFLIQRTQNKESEAINLKLNEIVAVIEGASNRLINIEDLGEDEVHLLHARYQALADRAKRHITASHSIEEAQEDN